LKQIKKMTKAILVLMLITPICANSGEKLLEGLLNEVDLSTGVTSDLAALGFTPETLVELQSLSATKPQAMSTELKTIASKAIGATIISMEDNNNAVKMCEVDDKMFDNTMSHALMKSEAKGKTFEQDDNTTQADVRHKYHFQLEVCVLKKLHENGAAAAALRPRLERVQKSGVFRNSLSNVTKQAKQLLHEMLVQDGMSHEDFEVLYSGNEIDEDAFLELESIKRMNERDQHRDEPQNTMPARRLMEAKNGVRPQHRAEEQNVDSQGRWGGWIPHWHHRHHRHHTHYPWRNNNQKKAIAAATLIYYSDSDVRANMKDELSGYSAFGFYHGGTGVDMGVMRKGNDVILAYRGTEQFSDILADLAAIHVPWPYSVAGTVHAGFLAQFVDSKSHMYNQMKSMYDAGHRNWLVTGHSLGGALAVLAAYYLKSTFPHATIDVVTFGAPAAAGPVWTHNYRSKLGHYTASVVNERDTVPCLPPSWLWAAQPQMMHYARAWPWERHKWHFTRVNDCAGCVMVNHHGTSKYCSILGARCHK
jgi:hypothetical protein